MSPIAVEEFRRVSPPVGVGPKSWFRRWFPVDPKVAVSDTELAVLILCNVLTTVGLAGDISRHLLHPDQLSNDFVSSWHLVLYGGVLSVGIWLGVGTLRHGPAYMMAASCTLIGFGLLSIGGVCDALWHSAFGTEAAVEALVSPPHLVVYAGLTFLLTSPLVILWKRPARRLGLVPTVAVVASVVSTVLVTSLFTGFLSPLAGGLSLQAGYIEPLVGESLQEYDEVRGLGIAVWTVAVLAAAFTTVLIRFRLMPGAVLVAYICIGVPAVIVTSGQSQPGHGLWPLVIGFVVAGLVMEAMVAFFGRPTLGRAAAAVACAASGAALWAITFAALGADDRLGWNESLWGGTVVLSALVGAAVAGLVALPAPTGDAVVDSPIGPRPA